MDQTGTWTYTSSEDLLRVIDVLMRTKGVLSINVLPGHIVYRHQPWAQINLARPIDEPLTLREKLEAIDLSYYDCESLIEGVIFGWEQLRKRARHPSHVCVWDRTKFYKELFPESSWPFEVSFIDDLYGMQVVELDGEANEGTVILLGSRVANSASYEDVDLGLLVRRSK